MCFISERKSKIFMRIAGIPEAMSLLPKVLRDKLTFLYSALLIKLNLRAFYLKSYSNQVTSTLFFILVLILDLLLENLH